LRRCCALQIETVREPVECPSDGGGQHVDLGIGHDEHRRDLNAPRRSRAWRSPPPAAARPAPAHPQGPLAARAPMHRCRSGPRASRRAVSDHDHLGSGLPGDGRRAPRGGAARTVRAARPRRPGCAGRAPPGFRPWIAVGRGDPRPGRVALVIGRERRQARRSIRLEWGRVAAPHARHCDPSLPALSCSTANG
jgi:hypothetical protein